MSLAASVGALLGIEVAAMEQMHGGNLSAVYRLTLADGRAIIAKVGASAETEAAMLRAIRASGGPAPEVIASSVGLLVMESLATGGSLASAWDDLAAVLIRLHGSHGASYGWVEDYAFGSVAICNRPSDDWPSFWAERRLLCHLPHLPASLACRIERLARHLPELLPQAPAPSLLHGDLWGGNILAAGGVVTGLIDPACYYGDREVDAAMLALFDHPPERFFTALCLEPGWSERQPVYLLWPCLVHLRLFGDGYRSAVESCLSRLGA